MYFEPTENQRMITEMVDAFAERFILPHRLEWDETQHFPRDVFTRLGELGLMGIFVSPEYGGSGMNYQEYVTAVKEISKHDPSIGLSVAAHNSLCVGHIYYYASDEQKRQYLPRLASGEHLGAWALTEPNTGSDAGSMETVARKEGDEWVINGAKNFITHGISADVYVIMARTGEKGAKNNATAFIVERGTPGIRGGKKENKLGMRASETAEVILEDCRVPDANVIGKVGEGFKQALGVLDGGRISIASLALGIAEGAYRTARDYALERHQFGRPIASFQAIAFKIADMRTQLEAAELLTRQAAYLKDHGKPVTLTSAMAKYYASEVSVAVSLDAVQILGGYGYIKDFPAEKFYRDAKLCTIGEGTSEIQKLVISRRLLKSRII